MKFSKRIIVGLAGLSASAAAVAMAGGTYSFFSDNVPNVTGATTTFGTLSLTAGLNDASMPVTVTNAKPGDVIQTGSLAFHNAGTIDGALRLKIVPDASNSTAFNNDVIITIVGVGYYPASDPLASGTETLAQASALTATGLPVSPMFAGRYKNFSYTVSVDPNAGNELQGATGGFTIQADLVQAGNDTSTPPIQGAIIDGTPSFPAPAA